MSHYLHSIIQRYRAPKLVYEQPYKLSVSLCVAQDRIIGTRYKETCDHESDSEVNPFRVRKCIPVNFLGQSFSFICSTRSLHFSSMLPLDLLQNPEIVQCEKTACDYHTSSGDDSGDPSCDTPFAILLRVDIDKCGDEPS